MVVVDDGLYTVWGEKGDETGKRRTITDNDQLSSNLWVRESGWGRERMSWVDLGDGKV